MIGDVAAMHGVALANHSGLPVILFGHSMGGLIGLNAAMAQPRLFKAVAVWNSNFHPGLSGRLAQAILAAERMLKGSDVPSAILSKLTFSAWGQSIPNRRTEFDWLSRDAAQVDKYVADPLCGFDPSVSLWIDIFALTFRALRRTALAKLPLNLPLHLVGGGQDPATDKGKAIVWLANHLKRSGFSNITSQIYQDMRHETVNETGAAVAIDDFANWCDRVTARS